MTARVGPDPSVLDAARPLVVSVLAAAVLASVAAALSAVVWPPVVVVPGLLAVWEAEISHRLTAAHRRDRAVLRAIRGAEFVALVLVAKVVHLLGLGRVALLEVAAWPQAFFEPETLVGIVSGAAVWAAATNTIADTRRIGMPGDRDVPAAMDGLARRFLRGGIVLLLAGSIAAVGWDALVDLRRPVVAGLVWPAVVYFPLGFWVLGRLQLTDRLLFWRRDGVDLDPDLRSRWTVLLLVVVGVATVLAFVLPTGADRLAAFPLLVLGAVVRLYGWLMSWLGGERSPRDPAEIVERLAPATTVGPRVPTTETPPPLGPDVPFGAALEALWSLLFWVALLGLVTLLVRTLVAERWSARGVLSMRGLVTSTIGSLREILRATVRLLAELLRALFRRDEAEPGAAPTAARRTWTRAVARADARARRAIEAYYHRFLDAARVAVAPRRPSETPWEYEQDVADALAPVMDAVDRLTDLFVAARYGTDPLGPEAERAAAAAWRRIERALRSEEAIG